MSLVTVQRTPSPSNTPDSADLTDFSTQSSPGSRVPYSRQRSFSESYFTVKGAALILPQAECRRKIIKRSGDGGDIQTHLQSMFYLLQQEDTIRVAVKLESAFPNRVRYMAIISRTGRQNTEESLILGFDCNETVTIGLVFPLWADTDVRLDGDGGCYITSNHREHFFKPISVQAMWSALQTLHKVCDISSRERYFPGGLTHTWVGYYEARINSDQSCINEWNAMEDILSHRQEPVLESGEKEAIQKLIKVRLREIMMTVDLDNVTGKYLRTCLEDMLCMDLKEYKSYVDEVVLLILGQMDSASEIFSFLYLGSEWNASNLEELKSNEIGFILNCTREIDNFFPGLFNYLNIREYDVEETDMLKYWGKTFRYIAKARSMGSKVLVHCKMGVSRSASTVMAFAMKEYGWSLEKAFDYVKEKRGCVQPNKAFMKQLVTYKGILNASKQRHNQLFKPLFRSKSETNLKSKSLKTEEELEETENIESYDLGASPSLRPASWSQKAASHNVDKNDRNKFSIGGSSSSYDSLEEEADVRLLSYRETTDTQEDILCQEKHNYNQSEEEMDSEESSYVFNDEVFDVEASHLRRASVPKQSRLLQTKSLYQSFQSSPSSPQRPLRRDRRVSSLPDLHQMEQDEDEDESLASEENWQQEIQSEVSGVTKIMPDKSWLNNEEIVANSEINTEAMSVSDIFCVKNNPTSMDNFSEITDSASNTNLIQCDKEKGVYVQLNMESEVEANSYVPVNTAMGQSETLSIVEQEYADVQYLSAAADKCDTVQCSSTAVDEDKFKRSSADVGLWQHYGKEEIPFSPGTVRRQKNKLEYGKEDIPFSPGTMRRQKHKLEYRHSSYEYSASETLTPPSPRRNINRMSLGGFFPREQMLKSSIEDDGLMETESSGGKNMLPLTLATTGYVNTTGESFNNEGDCGTTESQSYQPAAGLVRRTTQELEDRTRRELITNKLLENVDDGPSSPVQRSASLKERRITPNVEKFEPLETGDSKSKENTLSLKCARDNLETSQNDIVSPLAKRPKLGSSSDYVHNTDGKRGYSADDSVIESSKSELFLCEKGNMDDTVVMKIRDEEVPVKPGKVKRRTMDFEQRRFVSVDDSSSDSSSDSETSDSVVPENRMDPDTLHLIREIGTCLLDSSETGNETVDTMPKNGLVKQITMAIERRWGSGEGKGIKNKEEKSNICAIKDDVIIVEAQTLREPISCSVSTQQENESEKTLNKSFLNTAEVLVENCSSYSADNSDVKLLEDSRTVSRRRNQFESVTSVTSVTDKQIQIVESYNKGTDLDLDLDLENSSSKKDVDVVSDIRKEAIEESEDKVDIEEISVRNLVGKFETPTKVKVSAARTLIKPLMIEITEKSSNILRTHSLKEQTPPRVLNTDITPQGRERSSSWSEKSRIKLKPVHTSASTGIIIQDSDCETVKLRTHHGKTHPLAKLAARKSAENTGNPFMHGHFYTSSQS